VTGRRAIVGSGSIGVAFAIVFARSGAQVTLWDPRSEQLSRAIEDIRARLAMLDSFDLLDESPKSVIARIRTHDDLASATADAELIQECAPEDAATKAALYDTLATLTRDHVILASSSSALTPSQYADGCVARDRILGAHPANPPYLLPLIELIPGPHTDREIIDRASDIYRHAGLSPVLVPVEIEGFIMNRLQGAVLREAYCLVRDRVASVEDIDTVMRTSLGPRWSFMGPFETVDLNTLGGISEHARRMGPAYSRMGESRGMREEWTHELVAEVDRQRRQILPLSQWMERVHWRDAQLMRLNRLMRERLGLEADK
jgi:3-hydroxyacyl-CoA dehydrogenase